MARARNIKPAFFSNDILADIQPLGRILFIGLWTIADREGRLEDRHRRIKAELLPYDNCDVNELLDDLQQHGFITRYEVDGVKYIHVDNFTKHQNPHVKEAASTIPAPDVHSASTVQAQQENKSMEVSSDTSTKRAKHETLPSNDAQQNSRSENDSDLLRANEINMQGKTGASTIQAPYKHGEKTADSLLLIPDSLNPIDISCGQKTAPPADQKNKVDGKSKPQNQTQSFDDFWNAYPKTARRVAKAKCQDTWKRHKLDDIAHDIIDHVKGMSETEQRRTGYEPAPLTYLNQKRWQDGIPDEKPKGSKTACGLPRHFGDIDYAAGLTQNEDGSYAF